MIEVQDLFYHGMPHVIHPRYGVQRVMGNHMGLHISFNLRMIQQPVGRKKESLSNWFGEFAINRSVKALSNRHTATESCGNNGGAIIGGVIY